VSVGCGIVGAESEGSPRWNMSVNSPGAADRFGDGDADHVDGAAGAVDEVGPATGGLVVSGTGGRPTWNVRVGSSEEALAGAPG
jgi:hypothetical protein